MKDDDKTEGAAKENDALLRAAEERLAILKKWSPRLWAWNSWLAGTSLILTGLTPFGLGLLLFIPSAYSQATNIILIIFSAIAFVTQVLNVTQRHRDRSLHLRAIAGDLEWVVSAYKSGDITREEFSVEFNRILKRYADEPAP